MKYCKILFTFENIKFICLRAESLRLLTLGNFDIVYSRFFLHTINKVTQDKIFQNLINITKTNSLVCLEFRTIKDSLYLKGKSMGKHERITDHYRRFIDLDELLNLSYVKNNFSVIYKPSSNYFQMLTLALYSTQ